MNCDTIFVDILTFDSGTVYKRNFNCLTVCGSAKATDTVISRNSDILPFRAVTG